MIVNAAAHTAVDKAESEPELARTLNATAPGVLAREARGARRLAGPLLHRLRLRRQRQHALATRTTPTGPLSVYGRTKLEGEEAIRASGCRHLILRTSWVYAARGGNFAQDHAAAGRASATRLTVIDDQFGAPTGAELLADVTAHALRARAGASRRSAGTYHLVAGGETSWHGYARFVHRAGARGRRRRCKVGARRRSTPVPTSAFPTPAQRPHNSRLRHAQAAADLRPGAAALAGRRRRACCAETADLTPRNTHP